MGTSVTPGQWPSSRARERKDHTRCIWGLIILSPSSFLHRGDFRSASFYKTRKVDEVTSEVALHPRSGKEGWQGCEWGSELPGAGCLFYQLLEVGGCLVQL